MMSGNVRKLAIFLAALAPAVWAADTVVGEPFVVNAGRTAARWSGWC